QADWPRPEIWRAPRPRASRCHPTDRPSLRQARRRASLSRTSLPLARAAGLLKTSAALARPALIVHGGAGPVPDSERQLRQDAVDRARDAGRSGIGGGALPAAVAAARHMEAEPVLTRGIGAGLRYGGQVGVD